MKFLLYNALLFVSSALFIFYLISNQPILKWQELSSIENIEKTTESEFIAILEVLYLENNLVKYLNISLVFALILFIGFLILAVFSSLHIILDKIFFKKYFESPLVISAYRRAFWVSIAVAFVTITTIYRINFPQLLIPFFIIILILEYLFTNTNINNLKLDSNSNYDKINN